MKVRKLPIDTGPAAWNALLPTAPGYASLEGNQTADWLVIGAGFAGLSAARRLAQLCPEDRIVVLEARRVAEGPAGRNSGFMIDLPHNLASEDYGGEADHDLKNTVINRMAIAFAADAAKVYEMPAEAFRPVGKINAAATQRGLKHNEDYARHLETIGESFEMLDTRAMRDMTGTDYYLGGLYTPGTAMLQPALYIRRLATGVSSNKVRLHEGSPVTSLERQGGDWVVTTPAGRLTAPRVILAVNGHIQSFGYFARRLMHVFTYASMTRALDASEVRALGGQVEWGVTPADPMGTTVRRISGEGGHRIVIRNRFTFDPSMEVSNQRVKAIGRDHDRSFRKRFPMLGDIDMDYRWAGRLCLSRNDVPAFGELDQGLFSACCQNGLGTTKGTLSGILTAELACGLKSEVLDVMMAHAPPTRLPPEPIASIGAKSLIRWNELRAGAEF